MPHWEMVTYMHNLPIFSQRRAPLKQLVVGRGFRGGGGDTRIELAARGGGAVNSVAPTRPSDPAQTVYDVTVRCPAPFLWNTRPQSQIALNAALWNALFFWALLSIFWVFHSKMQGEMEQAPLWCRLMSFAEAGALTAYVFTFMRLESKNLVSTDW